MQDVVRFTKLAFGSASLIGLAACVAVEISGDIQFNSSSNVSYTAVTSSFCDSGDLTSTCNITTARTITSNTLVQGTGILNVNGAITVNSGVYFKINMTGAVNINASISNTDLATTRITVISGGALVVASSINGNMSLTGNSLTLTSTGSLSASGYGYAGGTAGAGSGPGGGGSSSGVGAGGTYGGAGGAGSNSATVGTVYGNQLTTNEQYGSGGGGDSGSYGGNGGGSIQIYTTNGVTIASGASIHADGYNGFGNAGGGGSGGNIRIINQSGEVTNSSISGSVSADGGIGATFSTFHGGGGGGGRIGITSYRVPIGSDGSYRVWAGSGRGISYDGYFYTQTTTTANDPICTTGDLTSSCFVSESRFVGIGAHQLNGANLTITATGAIRSYNFRTDHWLRWNFSGPVIITGTIKAGIGKLTAYDVTINSGGAIYGSIGIAASAVDVGIVATNSITVSPGGTIDATTPGYFGYAGGFSRSNGRFWGMQTGEGTGGGLTSNDTTNFSAGGGAHGGNGGVGAVAASSGGTAYDVSATPNEYGSGGGGYSTSVYGGNGGALVKLQAGATIAIDGLVDVRGQSGLPSGCTGNISGGGGGAGAVYIQAPLCTGATGTINVYGGNGGGPCTGAWVGGGGGGGIFSQNCTTASYAGVINLGGGVGQTSASPGANGYNF